jgi:tetratricopeptide (TPR) repeat protein
MILTLELRAAAVTEPRTDAWFLPGDDIARCVRELTRCGLARLSTRIYLVPQSDSGHAIAGVLIVPAEGMVPSAVPAGMACRCAAGRMFLPRDAVFHPPVTDEELREICPWPIVFFHPVLGLSGFDEDEAASIANWLGSPQERSVNWNFARAGAAPLPALTSIVLRPAQSLTDLFGDAPDEIGTDDPGELPPSPDEIQDGPLSEAGRSLKYRIIQGIDAMLRRLPHTGKHRTWVNEVEDWARRKLQGMNSNLERTRNKELHRLLHMLEKDPEAGLRHAIPMNDFAHRGLGKPGGRLGERSPDFDARRLGGGPADFWHVPDHLQQVLRRRYREMADRELQLGRHRRAAYIYAELLGDLVSAAHTLKQGRFYREAAVLYEEHLHNAMEAARCFAEAGMLAEAIERYERLHRWLEMADLHERMGDHAAAVRSVRRMVEEHLSRDDVLSAATLIEKRLQLAEEAADLLEKSWPASKQAGTCLAPLFQILARLGKHDRVLSRLARFKREPVSPTHLNALLEALNVAARTYPADAVRHRAQDLSRVLIAGQLQRSTTDLTDIARMVDHLVRLAPEDRLLGRDANTHLEQRRARAMTKTMALPTPSHGDRPRLNRTFDLPRQIKWVQLRREWHWFFALGVTPKRLTLLRGGWDGEFQSLSWECQDAGVKDWGLFEPTGEQGSCVALVQPGGAPLKLQQFPATDAFFARACLAGTPDWLPRQSYPVAFGEDMVWSVHVAGGRAVLSCHDKRGHLMRTIDITDELLEGAERTEHSRVRLVVVSKHVVVSLGNRMVVIDGAGKLQRLEASGQILQLTTTLLYTRKGVVAFLEHGAVMHCLGTDKLIELDRDLPAPMGAFVPGGPLVLISGWHAVLLDVDNRGVHKVTRMDLTGAQPVAVCGTAYTGEFAVLTATGQVSVYQTPRTP